MTKELVTLLGDVRIGVVRIDRNGKLGFEYDEPWRARRDAVPLSLSIPLVSGAHGHRVVSAFLWGLLPDNERILEAWGKHFQVSARNPFALLAHVGEDCPGAVRFVLPARAERLMRGDEGSVDWLSEAQVGARLRALKADPAAWRIASDTGQFSLGGAQPKTALFFDGKRWGVPSGPIPTTHILKPDVPGLRDHAQNEHFCLALAAELDLPVAESAIGRFDGELAIVIARYDRIAAGRRQVTRIHQEDLCQAFGIPPIRKYENDSGPGVKAIAALLRESSRAADEDIGTFVRSLAFNWVIAGTDAHAKNYSILLGAGSKVRLAPLYDVASVLPDDGFDLRRLKLAMKIGGKYRLHEIGRHQWQKSAVDFGIDDDRVLGIVRTIADEIPDRSSALRERLRTEGLEADTLDRLSDAIAARARQCAETFA